MKKIGDYSKTMHFQTFLYDTVSEMNEQELIMKLKGYNVVSHSFVADNKIRVHYSKSEERKDNC